MIRNRVCRIAWQRGLGHAREVGECRPGRLAAWVSSGNRADNALGGVVRSRRLDVVDDVGEESVVEHADAPTKNCLTLAEPAWAIRYAKARTPIPCIRGLSHVARRGAAREARGIVHVDARIRSPWSVERCAVVLVPDAVVDAQILHHLAGV